MFSLYFKWSAHQSMKGKNMNVSVTNSVATE